MNTENGHIFDGEKQVAAVLSVFGHKVDLMPLSWSKFDILMDGKIKVEVKSSQPGVASGKRFWNFNIHRNNKVDETEVDIYIFRFEGIPGSKKAIHALFKPPIGKPTLRFTERQLLEGAIADQVKAFRELNLKRRINAAIV
jgi:hypothetical protein